MESAGYRHRRSPSSDRFLGFFSFSPPSTNTSSTAIATGDELMEAEVFWTNEFTEPNHNLPTGSITTRFSSNPHRLGFDHSLNSGILAVLPDSDHGSKILYRKSSIPSSSSSSSSSSRLIPVVPRPPQSQGSQDRDYSQSLSSTKFHQSAPMNVPVFSKAMEKRRNTELFDLEDDDGDDEMLPPHEIVSRGSGVSPKTTFSVLEGVGRTLKGRDLRQVRNAIWRKTGFLD
ncbi:hypothetical protein FNV43_RR15544 [Rhamnella rubrinervis]|uniref:Senescence regulator S40 n=1 Tax=Rhamnella rubrinervis TaxID=2594499 RepID=A0A8K0E921_9ROSA|nr:hypothetical protein FNV43_RR15544 [Rhamnella rubrinervis]